jgi:hypothetical protein
MPSTRKTKPARAKKPASYGSVLAKRNAAMRATFRAEKKMQQLCRAIPRVLRQSDAHLRSLRDTLNDRFAGEDIAAVDTALEIDDARVETH